MIYPRTGKAPIQVGTKVSLAASQAHYPHQKSLECNYADGTVPVDNWFGSFHDGTPGSRTRIWAAQ